jgi:threonine dehydrogenase-like Zn-dependent dehydrogenase
MKALIMSEPGDVRLSELPTPSPAPDEVLIAIRASGICTNDVRDYRGDCDYSYPRIGGHEYCGIIAEVGSDVSPEHFRVGQSVVSYIIESCHRCGLCKTGNENVCPDHQHSEVFRNPDGISGYRGFAEYVCAKADDLIAYERETSFAKMAFTEPLACVVNSVNRTDVRLGQDVVVVGGGTMGLLHVMLLARRGARVIVSEPMAERRERVLALGASDVVDPTSCDPVRAVLDLTHGAGASFVYDTCAQPAIAAQAIEMTGTCGTCVMFSSIHPRESVPVDLGALHSLQKSITGAVSPTMRAYYESVQLIDKGIVDPTPLIEGIYDYTDFQAAMDAACRPDTYKVIVKFGEW